MTYRSFFVIFLLFSSSHCRGLHAEEPIDKTDWINDWPGRELPGTEGWGSIDVDSIDQYSLSVTYALDGGRFGDQLTNYIKALWLSWKYDLPFIYRPFDYSDQLVLSASHPTSLSNEALAPFTAKLEYFSPLDLEISEKVFFHLDNMTDRHKNQNIKLIWNIGLLTPFLEEHFCEKLDDEAFRDFLHQLVKPKKPLQLIPLPKNKKTIAIHYRTGVGYDWEHNIRNMPTKFPPETFYFNSLKQAAIRFNHEPLYIYLFTDHPDPLVLQEKFIAKLIELEIENDCVFDCRSEDNFYSKNVLEDLFSMMQFDCLIHPDSSFSRLAAILAAPFIEIKPLNWAVIRRDANGNAMHDKEGHVIVDSLVVERYKRGKAISNMHTAPVEDCLLFE